MFTYLHLYPIPPFFPSLISLIVSVDVKHHVYLLTPSNLLQVFIMAVITEKKKTDRHRDTHIGIVGGCG